MQIIHEIDIDSDLHQKIQSLRNACFPEHAVSRSYFKQLPHIRLLEFREQELIAHIGLDYRVVGVGEQCFKILGVIDFCVDHAYQNKGIGSAMLADLSQYAHQKDVDFIVLFADKQGFYESNGFQRVQTSCSWLRVDEHKSYGLALETVDDLYIKKVGNKNWEPRLVDLLGYKF